MLVEHRVGGRGGQPILPRSLLGLPGMAAGLGGLFVTMAIFGGWLFSLALELQDALAESAPWLYVALAALAAAGVVLALLHVRAGREQATLGQPAPVQAAQGQGALGQGAPGQGAQGQRARQ